MAKTYFICKYTPIEVIKAFGDEPVELDYAPESFEEAENHIHPNVCGYGKAIIEAVLTKGIKRLVLVACCDTIKSVYDVLNDIGEMEYLYMFDLAHCGSGCSKSAMEDSIKDFIKSYSEFMGKKMSTEAFLSSFDNREKSGGKYIGVLGARMGHDLFDMTKALMPLPVRNLTCVNNRDISISADDPGDTDGIITEYADALLSQMPCMRMHDPSARRTLSEDPDLCGIIYHTVKFCDFYGFEYASIKDEVKVPFLKIESDYTLSASGQLATRISAFAEGFSDIALPGEKAMEKEKKSGYFAGIDSGSTSTDVVIMDADCNIITEVILPTGAGAAISAKKALEIALEKAGLRESDISGLITTGYGRDAITIGDKSVTEITCHARGAHFLDRRVRTVIDIGGQDSKVIKLNANGGVENFVMNDKCAAGTGRFLEMMANTLQLSLDEISAKGVDYKEDITISSMCTVFAESEVVSLIAANKSVDDIVHGLNKSVATKTVSLVKRAGGAGAYMMTGGVSKNSSLVEVLNEKLGEKMIVSEKAQLCGAIGAALFALELS